MAEFSRIVSMSPAPIRFRLDPETEAYFDALFREPDGFGHESADENEFHWSPSSFEDSDSKERDSATSDTTSDTTSDISFNTTNHSDLSSTPSGVWVRTPVGDSAFLGSYRYHPYYDDCDGRNEQDETASSCSWLAQLKARS